jgi:hypothetical protein
LGSSLLDSHFTNVSLTTVIPTAKSVWDPAEPIGFAGLCKAMQPAEIDSFAYLGQVLTLVGSPEALSVFDPSTSKFLEHYQLRCDPCYKATWNTSYGNELGWLCQGIGLGCSPNTKWVAGANTFFLLDYHNILVHKQKEICHTMVVCEVRPENDDHDFTRITIGGNHICFPSCVFAAITRSILLSTSPTFPSIPSNKFLALISLFFFFFSLVHPCNSSFEQ